MSFSASNIDSLRQIYCYSDLETDDNWGQFKEQLGVNFEETIEEGLEKKSRVYFNHLIDNITEIFNNNRWSWDNEIEGEKIFAHLVREKGRNLAPFLSLWLVIWGDSFRHEILRMSIKGAKI